MKRDDRILQLMQSLHPLEMELKNESARHANHIKNLGGVSPTGETHYKLFLVSAEFIGKPRIDRQRMILDLLKDEFNSGLHALEIKALTPEENQKR